MFMDIQQQHTATGLSLRPSTYLTPMVTWQTFVEIAFDVADDKGAQFAGITEGGAFMSDLGDVWSNNKQQYKQMTEQQARNKLENLVEA
jgi:hypothetical protein